MRHLRSRARLALLLISGGVASCGGGAHKADSGATGSAGRGAAGTMSASAGSSGGPAGVSGVDAAAGAAGAGAGAAGVGAAGTSASDGGTVATLPDFLDGTRLKARAYVTDDGKKLWHGWWDSKLEAPCAFEKASDGQVRCIPTHEQATEFTDSQCKDLVLVRDHCEAPPAPYVMQVTNAVEPCAGGPVHKLVGETAPPLTRYTGGATCEPSTATFTLDFDYWSTGAAEPATAFVAAEELHDGRGAGLMARYYRGEDGSLQLLGGYDPRAARACAASPLLPGRCLPEPLVAANPPPSLPLLGEYADAACAKGTVIVYPSSCEAATPPPDFVFDSVGGACSDRSKAQLYRLGAPYKERPFLNKQGVCAQTTSNKIGTASMFRYLLGQAVPPETFPAVRVVDEGAGRVKVRTIETTDGQHVLTTRLFDSALGDTCTPVDVGGVLHCLPDEVVPELYTPFTDATCTHVAYWGTGAMICGLPKQVVWREPRDCNGRKVPGALHLYEVGAPMTVGTMYSNFGGTCQALTPSPFNPIYTLTEKPLTDAPVVGGN